MTTLSRSQASAVLANLGFRTNTSSRLTQSIRDFQTGWNLGSALKVDGVVGPATSAALLKSEARRRAGLGTISANFSFREFACKCGGRYAGCRRVWVKRIHVQRMEALRARLGRALSIVSGCRCPDHNEAVNGAKASQHQFGVACDISGPDKDTLRSWRIFAGIGYSVSTDRALHVDSRDKGGHNLTGGSPSSPTVWRYA